MRLAVLACALLALLALAPAGAHAATDAGRPVCDYCRMLFEHDDFGARVTLRGGVRKRYDAVECLAAAVLTDSVAQRDIRAIEVVNHDPPHARVALDRAWFLHSKAIESPMGLSIAAFGSRARAAAVQRTHPGELLDWRGLLTHVNRIWYLGKLEVEPHTGLHVPPPRPHGAGGK